MKSEPATGLLTDTIHDWLGHNCMRLGAALAYYSLISLAPLLVIAVGIGGAVLGQSAAQGRVTTEVTNTIGPGAATVVKSMLEAHRPGGLRFATIVSGIILLVAASGVFAELKADLNTIWDVPASNQKTGAWGWVKTRLLAFVLVLAIGALLLATLLATPVLHFMLQTASRITPATGLLLRVGDIAVTVAVVTILLALVFKLLPDMSISWKDVWKGALVTAALFTVGKIALGYYFTHSAVSSSYGAAGSVVSILIFTYYSWLLLLLGAEFTETYARMYGSQAHEPAPQGPRAHAESVAIGQTRAESEAMPAPSAKRGDRPAPPIPSLRARGLLNREFVAPAPRGYARESVAAAPRGGPRTAELHGPQERGFTANEPSEPAHSDREEHSMPMQSEVAYLQDQTDAARTAMHRIMDELKASAKTAANPVAWARQYPKTTAAIVGGVGLAAGAILLSRHNRREAKHGLQDLFAGRRKAAAEKAVSARVSDHRGILAAIMAAAAGAAAPLIKAALQSAISSAVSPKTTSDTASPQPTQQPR
jgi:membrane protein